MSRVKVNMKSHYHVLRTCEWLTLLLIVAVAVNLLIMWHFIGFGTDRATIDNIIRFQGHTVSKKDGTVVKSTSTLEVGDLQQQSPPNSQKMTEEMEKLSTKENVVNGKKQ